MIGSLNKYYVFVYAWSMIWVVYRHFDTYINFYVDPPTLGIKRGYAHKKTRVNQFIV